MHIYDKIFHNKLFATTWCNMKSFVFVKRTINLIGYKHVSIISTLDLYAMFAFYIIFYSSVLH